MVASVGQVGQENEGTATVGSKFREHLKNDLDEIGVDDCKVGLAVVHGERGEPLEDGGARVRVRIRVWGLGIVKGDMRGESVDELVVSHGSEFEL